MIDNGILLQNKSKGICLVNNFGYYTIEYYDESGDAIILAESDDSKTEILDIYKNCEEIDGYLETLIGRKTK